MGDIASAIQRLVATAGPGVVGLTAGARGGSGLVVGEGRVLTLARNLRADEVSVAFSDGRSELARLHRADPDAGVALLEVPTGDSPLPSWADASAAPIGTAVFALADPGGRGLRATGGAVSSAPQSLRGPRGRPLDGLIEHTAPLPRGSAGGPLLDGEGRLLGINAVRLPHGLILALPASHIRARLDALAAGGGPTPPRLGVAVVPPRVARRLRRAVGLAERDGVLVRAVEQGSPAERAGVERGDLIVAMGGRETDSLDSLFAALDAAPRGRRFALQIVRGADECELEVSLERP